MENFIMVILKKIQNIFNEIKNKIDANSETVEILSKKNEEIIKEIKIYESKNIEYIVFLENENRNLNLKKDQLENIKKNLEEEYRLLSKEIIELKLQNEKYLNQNKILESSFKELSENIDQYKKNIEENKIKNLENEINIKDKEYLIEVLKKEKLNLILRLEEFSFLEKIKELYEDEEFKSIFNLSNCKDYFELTIKLNTFYNKSDFISNIKKAYQKGYDLSKLKNILEVYLKIEGLNFFEAKYDENYDVEYFDSISEKTTISNIKKSIFPGIMKGDIVKQKSVVITGE